MLSCHVAGQPRGRIQGSMPISARHGQPELGTRQRWVMSLRIPTPHQVSGLRCQGGAPTKSSNSNVS